MWCGNAGFGAVVLSGTTVHIMALPGIGGDKTIAGRRLHISGGRNPSRSTRTIVPGCGCMRTVMHAARQANRSSTIPQQLLSCTGGYFERPSGLFRLISSGATSGLDFPRKPAHDSAGLDNPNQCCPCPPLSCKPRSLAARAHATRAVRPLAGGRRSVQGRKAQKRRACLTGRLSTPGCRSDTGDGLDKPIPVSKT